MILILSDADDAHASLVERKLNFKEQKVFRLNLDVDSLMNTYVTAIDDCWAVSQNGITINSKEVAAVWPRLLSVRKSETIPIEVESNGTRLWRKEWNKSLFGLYAAIRSANWLNTIQNASLADNKFLQFAFARDCGFHIPEQILSNSRDELIKFTESHDTVALKFMSQDLYQADDGSALGLYVNKVSIADIEIFDMIGENPVTLQQYIEKKYEVRYTVIDEDHHACVIESQKSNQANIDWRRYDLASTPHRKIEPPYYIKSRVAALMKKLGLSYGALDFIVDQQNQWWYLEVNSSGQWLWIEDLTGLTISDSIVDALITRNGGKCESFRNEVF